MGDRHVTPRRTLALPPDDYNRLEKLRAQKGYRTLRETMTWLIDLGESIEGAERKKQIST